MKWKLISEKYFLTWEFSTSFKFPSGFILILTWWKIAVTTYYIDSFFDWNLKYSVINISLRLYRVSVLIIYISTMWEHEISKVSNDMRNTNMLYMIDNIDLRTKIFIIITLKWESLAWLLPRLRCVSYSIHIITYSRYEFLNDITIM